jgi:hypothetical protein
MLRCRAISMSMNRPADRKTCTIARFAIVAKASLAVRRFSWGAV